MGCVSSKGQSAKNSEVMKTQQSTNTRKDQCSRHQNQTDNPEPSELLIAVVGYTGSGMSQFIQDLTGSYQHGVGAADSMSQTTSSIQKVEANVAGRSITFIDTPGFDNLARDEVVVFRELSVWLSTNYGPNATLAGIVYMQNMTNDTLYQAGFKFKINNANTYLKISCCSDWPSKTVFVCSHWDEAEDPETKEKILKKGYWSSMTRKGSHMRRFGPAGDFERAQTILSSIIQLW